jgi:hypothetical protein
MNNNNDHSAEDDKPKIVLDELEGIKEFIGANDASISVVIPELNEMIPMLNETIPVLNQEIPELTAEVDIPENIKVSFDPVNSTETIEQQMVRTHHEQKATPLELLSEIESSPQEIDKTLDISIDETGSEQTDFTFTLVESNSEPVTTKSLVQQQYELEHNAQQQRTTLNKVPACELKTEHTTEAIIDNAWIKVEMLLMDHLPTQISGVFLDLLNSQLDENKQQLLNELELLDKDSLSELADILDVDQGF